MTVALSISTPSAIYDYTTLKTEWALRLDRSDLDSHFPQFVQLTESYLRRRLRVMDSETIAQQVVTSETFTLPSDILALRSIYIEGTPDQPLRSVSPAVMAAEFDGRVGSPVAYAIIGNMVKLAPPPDESVTFEMVYLAKFTPLTETSVSNWILEDHPDLYFYGCLAQACDYIQDTANSAKYGGLLAAMTEDLISARNRDKWGSRLQIPSGVRQVGGSRC